MKKGVELVIVGVLLLASLTACAEAQIQPSEPAAAVEGTIDSSDGAIVDSDLGNELTPSVTEEVSTLGNEIESGVTVTYVGNSGFLITTSHKKILIDAVFRGYDYVYSLPEDIQNSLGLAQPPFDNIDLILVSHSHRDHLDSYLVDQHLQNDPNTIFASQANIVALSSATTDQIISLDPEPGEPAQMDIDGIHVEALSLSHGEGQPTNIGFVITVDNIKIFYSGDVDFSQVSYEEFRAYQLPEQKIDIAFVTHFYFSSNPDEQRFLKEGIGAKYLIPMHYFFTDPPLDRTTILNNYPDAILFNKELTSWEMP
jgi:L-ascorbate metabolism protein UlaG (beta-lactamase superfamily)